MLENEHGCRIGGGNTEWWSEYQYLFRHAHPFPHKTLTLHHTLVIADYFFGENLRELDFQDTLRDVGRRLDGL